MLIRARIPEYVKQFEVYRPDLESGKTLPKDYEAGHACGRRYSADSLPTEAALRGDLQLLVRACLALTYRGGLDASFEGKATSGSDDGGDDGGETLTEIRRYRMHRRIERNPKASAEAKRVRGLACEACGFKICRAVRRTRRRIHRGAPSEASVALGGGSPSDVRPAGGLCGAMRKLPPDDSSHGGSFGHR